jgi:hypothetical protein
MSNVVNLSIVQLSNQYLKVLSKGLKFVPITRLIDTIPNIVNVESAFGKKDSIIKTAEISDFSEFITKFEETKEIYYQ